MSRAGRFPLLLALLFCMIASSFAMTAEAQMAGRLVIDMDYEVYGVGDLDGGGHITWSLYDEQASHLRWKIITFFENYSQMPPGFNCEGTTLTNTVNQQIDSNEGLEYTDMLEHYLEN